MRAEGREEGLGQGAQVLSRGWKQDSADHSHYFITNGEKGGQLPVARVPHVDEMMGLR